MSAIFPPHSAAPHLKWRNRVITSTEMAGTVEIEDAITCPLAGPAALDVKIRMEAEPDRKVFLAAELRVDTWHFDVGIDREAIAAHDGDLRCVLLVELKLALAREAERLENNLNALLDEHGDAPLISNRFDHSSLATAERSSLRPHGSPAASHGAYTTPPMVSSGSLGNGYMEAEPVPTHRSGSYVTGGYTDSALDPDGVIGANFAPLWIQDEGCAEGAYRSSEFNLLATGSPAHLAAEALLRAKEIICGLGDKG